MIHQDGIEVYVKPRGEDHDIRRFREVPQHRNEEDDHRMRSVVLRTNAKLKIVLRFSEDFDMFSATALNLLVANKTSWGRCSSHSYMIRPHSVAGGMITCRPPGKRGFEFTGWLDENDMFSLASSYGHYEEPVAGTMTVSLTRGNPQWIHGDNSIYGPLSPENAQCCEYGTFVPLLGEHGNPYRFEFVPEPPAEYRNITSRSLSILAEPLSLDLSGYTSDLLFRHKLDTARNKRTRLEKEWQAKQSEKVTIDSTTDIVKIDFQAGEAPNSVVSSVGTGSTVRAHDENGGHDPRTTPALEPKFELVLKRRPKPPPVCDCPVDHRPQPRRQTPKPISRAKIIRTFDDLVTKHATVSRAPIGEWRTLTPPLPFVLEPALPPAAQETTAKQCVNCMGFKAPPPGKKITYRKDKGRYMCVPQHAPDEADPEDQERDDIVANATPLSINITPNQLLWQKENVRGTPSVSIEPSATGNAVPEDPPAISKLDQQDLAKTIPTSEPLDAGRPAAAQELVSTDSSARVEYPVGPTASVHALDTGTFTADTLDLRKRSAEPLNDQPAAKQQRLLPVIRPGSEERATPVKSEQHESLDQAIERIAEPAKTRREKKIEEKLARTRRERRILQLEAQEEDLEDQLRAARERKRQNMIMVKAEVIEID